MRIVLPLVVVVMVVALVGGFLFLESSEQPADPEPASAPPVTASRSEPDAAALAPVDPTSGVRTTLDAPHEASAPTPGLHLRILDDQRRPVSGAELRAGGAATGRVHVVSDLDGTAVLLGAGDEPRVWVEADGFSPAIVRPGPANARPETALEVVLTRAARLAVQLGGEPEPGGSTLTVATDESFLVPPNQGPTRPEPIRWRGTSTTDGRVDLDGMPSNVPLRLEVRAPGLPTRAWPEPLVLQPGEQRELAWRLSDGVLVHGHVLDDGGQPVAGRTVWLKVTPPDSPPERLFVTYEPAPSRRTKTAADGSFRLDGVAPGHYWIGPAPMHKGSGEPAPLARLLEVPSDRHELAVELVAPRGLVIAGRVVGPRGETPERAHVLARHAESGGYHSVNADATGVFELGPLAPGSYEVVAERAPGFAPSAPLTLEVPARDVELRLQVAGALSCRALPAEGVTELTLALCPRDAGPLTSGVTAAQDFTFHWDNLAPGTYDLFAWASDGTAALHVGAEVFADDHTEGVELALVRGATVRMTSAAERSLWFRIRSGPALIHEGALNPNLPLVRTVPAGPIVIECSRGPEVVVRRELTAEPGEHRDVVLGD
jgi:hypothetical protein